MAPDASTSPVGHTPGPFAVHPVKAWIVCTQLDAAGEPCPVAALAWPTDYRSEDETLANGLLFAAAPELLEALEAAVECGIVPISTAADGGANRYSRQILVADMIRAAIAKARGEVA